jgi:hypothetical protein
MTNGKKRFVLVSVLIMLLLANFVCAVTGSIGNAKMILYPEVNGWFTTTIEKSILVKNVNEEVVEIRLEADEEGGKFLEILDEAFLLQPNEERKANFLVKVRKEGNYEGRINVFFSPIESEGPGVVLSSTIIVIAEKGQDYEEKEIEEVEEGNETVSIITGRAVGVNNEVNIFFNESKIPLLLGISSVVLLVVLVVLIIMMNKSKKRKKSGANKKSNYKKK